MTNTKNTDFAEQFNAVKRLLDSGAFKDALRASRILLSEHPGRFETLHIAGIVAFVNGDDATAVGHFRAAVALNDTVAETHSYLARALLRSGRLAESESAFDRVTQLNPVDGKAFERLGKIRSQLGKGEAARQAYKAALALNPDKVELVKALAQAEAAHGVLDKSKATLRSAIEKWPGHASLYFLYAPLHKFTPGDPLIAAMEQLASSDSLTPNEKSKLLFALGKAYDDLGEIETAFHHIHNANQIAREDFGPDTCKATADHDAIIKSFPASMFKDTPPQADDSPKGIFIVGMPRSGTSLVEQVLASHPATGAYGEVRFLPDCIENRFNAHAGLRFPQEAHALTESQMQSIGRCYLDKLAQFAPLPDVFIDKLPQNYRYVGLIRRVFPGARIIQCRRDPRAVGLSLYERYFGGPAMRFSFSLDEIAKQSHSTTTVMDHWSAVLPGFVLDLDYQTFVTDFEAGVRRLLEFCGLPWDDRCLRYWQTDRTVQTASAAQVRQPIYAGSLEKWRRYESHLGPLLELASD